MRKKVDSNAPTVIPKKAILTLRCEWIDCPAADYIFMDLAEFMDHVTQHLYQTAPGVITVDVASEPSMSISKHVYFKKVLTILFSLKKILGL